MTIMIRGKNTNRWWLLRSSVIFVIFLFLTENFVILMLDPNTLLQLHACRWIFGAFPFCPVRPSDFSISSELEDKVLCQLFKKPVEERQRWVLIHYKKYVSWKNAVSHSLLTKYITDHNHLLLLIQISCMMSHLWLLGAGNTANKTVKSVCDALIQPWAVKTVAEPWG